MKNNKPTIIISKEDSGGGCLEIVLVIMLVTAWVWGLPTPWGKFSFDLLPPAIRLDK